jgi:uncharacterized membrane protein
MAGPGRGSLLHITAPTRYAIRAGVLLTCATAMLLAIQYQNLPPLLAVHFAWNGVPNGWQFKTIWRVLTPVFVQMALLGSLGALAALLVWRPGEGRTGRAPDAAAAATAAEAVMLMALIWVAFQSYGAFALSRLWMTSAPTLGTGYAALEIFGLLLTILVVGRAHRRLGRPEPLPYIASEWRFGHLYCNAADPSLFVPTRDGRRWTLNFGRPAAALLMGGVLAAGVFLPLAILIIGLRS